MPSQAQEVLKEMREIINERADSVNKDRNLINPVIISTCAAIGQ